jgi:hypothetical protein
MQTNEKDAGGGVGIRLKLGSLFSPKATPTAGKARDDVDQGTFITADVLRVRSWSKDCQLRGE